MEESSSILEEVPRDRYYFKPELLKRVKSILIDGVVVISLLMVAAFIINLLSVESATIRAVCFILIFLYEPIFTSLNRTLGQKIMSIRVVQAAPFMKDNEKLQINIVSSIVRYIIKVILGIISLVTIHKDPLGKGIHDMLVGSMMIDES